MVGKTFKGLTDAAAALADRALPDDRDASLRLRGARAPETVVEIAIDGVQRSSRYPGGVALRFARVKGYRPDKSARETDTIDSLIALLR